MSTPVSPADDMSRTDPKGSVAAWHAHGEGVKRVGYPILLTRTTLVRRTLLNPSMLRLTVTGEDVASFHSYQADDHVKILLPMPDGTRRDPHTNATGDLVWPERPYAPARKYTVRRFDAATREIDLDVVVHSGGLLSEWAQQVKPGDDVVLAGPPGAKAFAHNYDHYLVAVDPTGLPALGRWLEESPLDVSAEVFVDIDQAHERDYPLAERTGVTVHWLSRAQGSQLAERVQAAARPTGRTFLFVAGEAGDIKPLRRWAKEAQIPALITGYWKRGVADLDE